MMLEEPEWERCMVLDRFLDDEDLECLGIILELPWFEENEVSFENRGVAQEVLVQELTTAEELQRALNEFGTTEPAFQWFLGEHYTVELMEDRAVVTEGENTEARREINERVAEESESDSVFGTALNDAVRNGHFGLSEIRALLNFRWEPDTERRSEHERAKVLDGISGVRVSEKDRRGYEARMALELMGVFQRGASGVRLADTVTVESEVFGRRGDPEELFLLLLPCDGRVTEGKELSIDDRMRGHGKMRVTETSPGGHVEVTDKTEIRVETFEARTSVMSDEMSVEERIEVGMADLVAEVLWDKDERVERSSVVESVEERLCPDRDVYHLIDGYGENGLKEYVDRGLGLLYRTGEAYKSEEGYVSTSVVEDES